MNTDIGVEKCFSFISCQIQPASGASHGAGAAVPKPFVTISRQSGCGAHVAAERLAEYLQARDRDAACPWTVFDRNLVEKVLEHHHLPKQLQKFMPEDRITEFADIMDQLFGLHPASQTLVHKTTETILHLAELGRVILVGRGANVITSKFDTALHVRLIGSLEKRVERIQHFEGLNAKQALAFAREQDRGRARYLKKYFGKDIDDPLLYHLVINTDFVSCEEAARVIGDAVLGRSKKNSRLAVASG